MTTDESEKNKDPTVLLHDRIPPISAGEFIGTSIVVVAVVHGFVLVLTSFGFVLSEAGLAKFLSVHVGLFLLLVIIGALAWRQRGKEQVLLVRAELLEFTESGEILRFTKHGTTLTMSHIRGHGVASNRIVVTNATVARMPSSLPETLTGDPAAFCAMMEVHGWLVIRPPRHDGRLY